MNQNLVNADAALPLYALSVPIFSLEGEKTGDAPLDPRYFDAPLRTDLLHQVVRWQLARRRSGLHETKVRGEVSGSNRKPYAQKRTGRARLGSRRAPHCEGGGVAFGPHNRDYEFSVNKKVRKLALRVAISDRVRSGAVRIVEGLSTVQKTKSLNQVITKLLGDNSGRVLVVSGSTIKAVVNMQYADSLPVAGFNVRDVLRSAVILIEASVLPALQARLV